MTDIFDDLIYAPIGQSQTLPLCDSVEYEKLYLGQIIVEFNDRMDIVLGRWKIIQKDSNTTTGLTTIVTVDVNDPSNIYVRTYRGDIMVFVEK